MSGPCAIENLSAARPSRPSKTGKATLAALDETVRADAEVTQEQERVTVEIKADVESVNVVVSETASLLGRHRLARQFVDMGGLDERCEFLDVLFAVAPAHGEACYEKIRAAAQSQKLSHRQFIAARLMTPQSAAAMTITLWVVHMCREDEGET